MNPRALSIGSASALVVAGLFVSLPANAVETTCQGQAITIAATADNQLMEGTDGADVISAVGFVNVRIDANGGDDLVCGGRYSIVEGGPGADTFVNKRYATLDYTKATAGVQIDLAAGAVVDGGETDTVIGFHSVDGSAYADTFVGTSGDDLYRSFTPGEASEQDRDVIEMGAGDDQVVTNGGKVDLGPGADRATAIGANVQGGVGDDRIDLVLTGVANGGAGDDVLTAQGAATGLAPGVDRFVLNGGPGRDQLAQPQSASNGEHKRCPEVCALADINGGSGRDLLLLGPYRGVVDLAAGRSRTSNGRADLQSIEDVRGSSRSDVIRGDAGRNRFDGFRGDDLLVGRGGDDILRGDDGTDRAVGGAGRDRCDAEVRRSCAG